LALARFPPGFYQWGFLDGPRYWTSHLVIYR
jgi:hypothetical protein